MRVESVKYLTGTVMLDKHFHAMHQMLFVTKGEILATVNGKTEKMSGGDLLIVSRLEEHSIRVLTPECNRYLLLVSSERSLTGNDNYLLSSVLVNRTDGFRRIINTDGERNAFESLFSKMTSEFDVGRPLYSEQIDLLFISLLIQLYRLSPEIFLSETKGDTSVVEKLQERFENCYSENFTLSSLAAEYHLSVSHLAHIFKSVTGYAPIDYLMACRLTAAKAYLASSSIPIKEIVDLCGFGDESNFSRMFKSKVGMTPTAYRKQYL